MKVKELIDIVNYNNFYCLGEVYAEIDEQAKQVEHGSALDNRRWWSTAVDVYEYEDGYVGVFGVYQIFSERMNYRDVEIRCHAKEYKAILCITYVPKEYEVD